MTQVVLMGVDFASTWSPPSTPVSAPLTVL